MSINLLSFPKIPYSCHCIFSNVAVKEIEVSNVVIRVIVQETTWELRFVDPQYTIVHLGITYFWDYFVETAQYCPFVQIAGGIEGIT